jgi:3-methyladenine DNA glycosylase AlkC
MRKSTSKEVVTEKRLFKDLYSVEFYDHLANVLAELLPPFNKKKFKAQIFDHTWSELELKQRMRHTTLVLHRFFPADFNEAATIIESLIVALRSKKVKESGLEYMFLPDYIEVFGINDFQTSVKLLAFVTQFTSCEFAVRPFIIKYGDRMLDQMCKWSLHDNHHVRRLASEGSRPRLPWAMALPALKKDPSPILPILENLKRDGSEYVRRSVANSLNDIAKDHPDVVIGIARKWKGISRETDGLIKHACRTLLKGAHPEVLSLYDLNSGEISLSSFKIITPKVKIGNNLAFSFILGNSGKKAQLVRLEYAVYYLRQNGQLSKKVFKISERQFRPGEKAEISRNQSFRLITTRTFYPGKHKLSIIVNGQELKLDKFELIT